MPDDLEPSTYDVNERGPGRERILVAEDDPGVRMTIGFVLEDEGFDVVFAFDGEAALELAKLERPDLILLDQMMPKLDGKQVLTRLRSDETTRDIPVLVVTGMGSATAEEWPGADLIGKPFSPDALVDRIRSALQES